MIITTKSLKLLVALGIFLRGGLGASTRPLACVLIVAVTLMIYGNVHVMTAEQEGERPGSASLLRFDGTDELLWSGRSCRPRNGQVVVKGTD